MGGGDFLLEEKRIWGKKLDEKTTCETDSTCFLEWENKYWEKILKTLEFKTNQTGSYSCIGFIIDYQTYCFNQLVFIDKLSLVWYGCVEELRIFWNLTFI